MRVLLCTLALGLGLVACKAESQLGCSSDNACPAGHACIQSKCEQLCTVDADCPSGYACEADFCLAAARKDPIITSVAGDGSASCAEAVSGRCFTDRIVVSGQQLYGAEFRLSGAHDYTLAAAGETTGIRATLLLPDDLVPGEYTLVAQNAAGSSDAQVMILQGEPGPDATGSELITKLNASSTSGRFVVDRLPVADVLIQHLNAASGAYKLKADIVSGSSGGGASSGNELVSLINGAATTSLIAAARVEAPSASTLVGLINGGAGTINASRVQAHDGTTLMTQINGAASGQIAASRVTPHSGATLAGQINGDGAAYLSAARLEMHTGAQLIDRINGAASGQIAEARLPTQRLYKQDTSADAAAIDVPFSELLPLCGDPDGCTVSMGYRYYDIDGVASGTGNWGPAAPTTLWGPGCRVHVSADGWWTVSQACTQRYWIDNGGAGTWTQYYDSGSADQDGDNDPITVLTYFTAGGYGCFLAESAPVDGAGGLQADGSEASKRFHFWMNVNETPGSFDHPSRTCELMIED